MQGAVSGRVLWRAIVQRRMCRTVCVASRGRAMPCLIAVCCSIVAGCGGNGGDGVTRAFASLVEPRASQLNWGQRAAVLGSKAQQRSWFGLIAAPMRDLDTSSGRVCGGASVEVGGSVGRRMAGRGFYCGCARCYGSWGEGAVPRRIRSILQWRQQLGSGQRSFGEADPTSMRSRNCAGTPSRSAETRRSVLVERGRV